MEKIENANKEVLVDIVKFTQKRGLQGKSGGWMDFLTVYDKTFGIRMCDPAKRTPEDLLAFVKTFTNPDDLKFFDRLVEKNKIVEISDEKSEKMSPEQELVIKTIVHPHYALSYTFPSHEEGWRVTKIKKKALKSNTMVAVDCEMVLCEDGTDALVRVCVVDRDLQVKLDELVKPDKPVVDYRTHITGIAAKDLENVTCSLQDVQVSMMKLLAKGTILVGHSLDSDLKALKVDHARVIDTSLIFKFWSGPNFRRPSLNDLCKSILGHEVRKEDAAHDCIEDARAAMKLVLAKIEAGDDNNMTVSWSKKINETYAMKLLCHRIPISLPSIKLCEIIPRDFTIEIKPNKRAGLDIYSALLVFKNKHEADEAFDSLDGEQDKDSSGRSQKLVIFKLKSGISGDFYIRKMDQDGDSNNNFIQVASNKRSGLFENENQIPSKKMKTAENEIVACNTCDGYTKEIESLKKKLSERDEEISVLHKLIVSQVRTQSGL